MNGSALREDRKGRVPRASYQIHDCDLPRRKRDSLPREEHREAPGDTDGIRIARWEFPDQGSDRERINQTVLHADLQQIFGEGGCQRFRAEDDGGSDLLIIIPGCSKQTRTQ